MTGMSAVPKSPPSSHDGGQPAPAAAALWPPFHELPFAARLAIRLVLSAALIAAGAFLGYKAPYWMGLVPPDPYSKGEVLKALPDDFPLPPDLELVSAGPGKGLPYRIVWRSPQPPDEINAVYDQAMPSGKWTWAGVERRPDHMEMLRGDRSGDYDHVAKLDLIADGSGSRLTLEFSPIPIASAPGWRHKRFGGNAN